MKHYDFSDKFRALYDKAVSSMPSGQTEQGRLFHPR